ncbi:MAG: CCA tRNA nucleotidyltransferase [Phreatobacter sp.]|uniref:CCA tRNA nucleotidyltransferase n=1 Tax=Phreatobacter sp. TaxID=1966341 RepID=UPI001A427C20|nr:CCA tRNA nucleotidyltransferase [Phreatobacter sp.]MBL8567861.1 CCA tRNA nucleotidyltransferase [Phreatobacter sp.]
MTDARDLPDWFREGPARTLIDALAAVGEEARPIGGAVRNWLAGRPSGDIDIATTALPEAVSAAAAGLGLKAVPTGIDHGTITVVAEGVGYEVTTLRQDVETDGRHAVVRFGRDWREDAARRDFTINAMSLGRDGEVHDYFGGRADLEAGRVRFIGEPRARIREDRLRILRFFRFHAEFGRSAPDAEGLAACIVEREGLLDLSRERVRAELLKILGASRAPAVLQVMADVGLLHRLLGGVPNVPVLERLAAIEAEAGVAPLAARHLGALAVLVREDADRLRERLALSNEEYRRLDAIGAGWHGLGPDGGEAAAKVALFRAGPRAFTDRALVAFARSAAPVDVPEWHALVSLPKRWQAPSLPISGEDLMRAGLREGPEIGAALAWIRQAWIDAGFPAGASVRQELIDLYLSSAGL